MTGKSYENGFSLIELLLVVVILGILAAIAVPAYQKATKSAENASAFSMLRTIHSTEVTYYSQNGRFGRLQEIYPIIPGRGTLVVDKIVRGNHTFEMAPATDTELRSGFVVNANRNTGDLLLEKFEVNESGRIIPVFP